MDINESNSEENLSQVDEIANLLGNDEVNEAEESTSEHEETDESTEDLTDDEDQTEESNEESNESDATWESALGVDDGQLAYDEESGDISGINVKVNGESSTVGMKDLIAGYQNTKSFTQKSQALAKERKDFEEGFEKVKGDYNSKLENVDQLTKFLESKLVQEYDNVNWEQLRIDNPAEYAASRQDFSARAQEMQQAQDAIAQERQDHNNEQAEKYNANRKALLKEQHDIMIVNNPEWSDTEKLNSDMAGLKSFMTNQYGFGDKDFANVTDARVIELIKDAKAFKEGNKLAKTKRNKPVPKFQKSKGGSNRKKASKLDILTKKAKTSSGSEKRDAQRDAIAELLSGE